MIWLGRTNQMATNCIYIPSLDKLTIGKTHPNLLYKIVSVYTARIELMSDIMLEEEFPHYPVNQVLRWFITWFAKIEMIFNHDFSDISGIVGFLVGVSVVQLGLTCCNCVHKFIFQRGDAKRRMGIVRLLWKSTE